MIRLILAAVVLATPAAASAQLQPPGAAPAAPPPILSPPAITTARGGGLVTGSPGTPQSIMIPGSPVPGMMLNNGNGTSTIMIPGGASETVPNPR